VVAIAIGLALTAVVALFVLPWVWKQIIEWLPVTDTAVPATPPPTATPEKLSLSGRLGDYSVLLGRQTGAGIVPA